jgi:hypothetical protein
MSIVDCSSDESRVRERVLAILEELTAVPVARVRTDPDYNIADVVAGYDGEILVGALRNEFGIDLRDFEFDRYFDAEAGFDFLALIRWAVSKKYRQRRRPLTIDKLVQAATAKKWPRES